MQFLRRISLKFGNFVGFYGIAKHKSVKNFSIIDWFILVLRPLLDIHIGIIVECSTKQYQRSQPPTQFIFLSRTDGNLLDRKPSSLPPTTAIFWVKFENYFKRSLYLFYINLVRLYWGIDTVLVFCYKNSIRNELLFL